MLSAKEAADIAHKYLEATYETKFATRIEEIELSEDTGESFWLITLDYWEDPIKPGGIIIAPVELSICFSPSVPISTSISAPRRFGWS